MTEEERRFAALLKDAVPTPPMSLSYEEIAARAHPRTDSRLARPARAGAAGPAVQHRRPWLPALAAACVTLAVAGGSVTLIRHHRSTPAAVA